MIWRSRDLCDGLLRLAAPLVPGDLRRDWLREWRAEVAWRASRARGRGDRARLVARMAGAFVHAAWLRRDRWRVEMLWQDVKYAVRMLARRPVFTSVATLTLALGIGANAAMFSVVHAVLIAPLPYQAPDGTVTAFAVLVGVGTSLLFGLIPALSLSGRDVHAPLKAGSRQGGDTVRHTTRRALIAAEVALSMMLLVGAALLLQSLWRLEGVDPGFRRADAVAMDVALPLARYPEGSQMPFYERLESRIRALPGVEQVGAVNILPLTANYDSRGIQIEDAPLPAGQNPSVQSRSVTPGYFAAMGIPLVRGRLFDARDTMARALVVVISASMAERYWPGQDPLGRRITFNSGIEGDAVRDVGGAGSREVIGVVGDVRHLALTEDAPIPMFYTPHTQQPSYHAMTLVVRTPLDAAALTPAVRALLSDQDLEVPLANARALAEVVSGNVAAPRLRATLLAIFAGLALVLACIGVYGVVAHLVGQRTHEIGVRLALGASPGSVVRLIAGDGLRPVVIGMAAGMAGALALSRVLRAMPFDVAPTEPSAYLAATAALLLAALAATLVPARRALGVPPMTALRGD